MKLRKSSIRNVVLFSILIASLLIFQNTTSPLNANNPIQVITADGNYNFLVNVTGEITNVTWTFDDGVKYSSGELLITPKTGTDGFNMLYWDSISDIWTEIDVVQYRDKYLTDEIFNKGTATANLQSLGINPNGLNVNQAGNPDVYGTKTMITITTDRDGDLVFGSSGDQFIKLNTTNFETNFNPAISTPTIDKVTLIDLQAGDYNNTNNNIILKMSFDDYFYSGDQFIPTTKGTTQNIQGAYGIPFSSFYTGSYNFSYYDHIYENIVTGPALATQAIDFVDDFTRESNFDIQMNRDESVNGLYSYINSTRPPALQKLQFISNFNPLDYSFSVVDYSNPINYLDKFSGSAYFNQSVDMYALNSTFLNIFNGTIFDTTTTPYGQYMSTDQSNITVDVSPMALDIDYYLKNMNFTLTPDQLAMNIFDDVDATIGFNDSTFEIWNNNFSLFSENRGYSGILVNLMIENLEVTMDNQYVLYEIYGISIFTDLTESAVYDIIMIDTIPIVLSYSVTIENSQISGLVILISDGMIVPIENVTEFVTSIQTSIITDTIDNTNTVTSTDTVTNTDTVTSTDTRTNIITSTIMNNNTITDTDTIINNNTVTVTIQDTSSNSTSDVSGLPLSNFPVILGLLSSVMMIKIISRKKK